MKYIFPNSLRITNLPNKLDELRRTKKIEEKKQNATGALKGVLNFGEFDTLSWKTLQDGNLDRLFLNFICTFQYPNPLSKEAAFKEYENNNIKLAPFREIVKVLFCLKNYNNQSYLTEDEIERFIFCDAAVACKGGNPNPYDIVKKIIEYRNDSTSKGSAEKKDFSLGRDLLSFGFLLLEHIHYVKHIGNKIELSKDIYDLNSDIQKGLFFVLTYDKYWDYSSNTLTNYSEYKKSYCDYCNKGYVAMKELNYHLDSNDKVKKDRNLIYFGAPGTGKSWTLKEDVKVLEQTEIVHSERVTFHPEYTYSQFVGSYKPVSINGQISYDYIPGPFLRMLVSALKSIQKKLPDIYVLQIEEINRANVAAVFGDIFQLLDRAENNESVYSVTTSEDMKRYLKYELGARYDVASIKIPSNMFIWATMNSADQGVFPMDTAFKRRWNFNYIGIDQNEEGIKDIVVNLRDGETINWNNLRKAINNELLSYVNEDKLIGPYFLKPEDFIIDKDDNKVDDKLFKDLFKNKVLMYLFEDAAKRKRSDLFSGCSNPKLYSVVCAEFDSKGVDIFNEKIRENPTIKIKTKKIEED